MNHTLLSFLLTVVTVVGFASCQQGPSPVRGTYVDAVVRLDQVDPQYREYFRVQHGANYGAAEQRRAFAAAVQTARTPVPAYTPAPRSTPRRAVAGRSRLAANKTAVRRSRSLAVNKARVGKKPVAKRRVASHGRKSASRRALAKNTIRKKR